MPIRITDEAFGDLANISDYISLDSKAKAHKFIDELFEAIDKIEPYPKKHRKSIYFEDENFRDMIHKKYTVVFEITKEEIIVLSVFKAREHKSKK